MKLHELKPIPGSKKKRVGRGPGSGLGKTSGKGHKGQMARKGATHKPGFEGGQMRLIRRIPKRGFTNPVRKEYIPVNVGDLGRFEDGTEVTCELLRCSGMASGRATGIKILGRGEIDKKLNVKVNAFSASGKAKIEAAGGSCEVVS